MVDPSLRYAVLNHDHPFPHWDLLLESEGRCRTWRLLDDPSAPGPWRAEAIADHRLAYLDYEGPVSGGRGWVTSWDRGCFQWIRASEILVTGHCNGRKWQGQLTLRLQTECHWLAEFIATEQAVG